MSCQQHEEAEEKEREEENKEEKEEEEKEEEKRRRRRRRERKAQTQLLTYHGCDQAVMVKYTTILFNFSHVRPLRVTSNQNR